MPRYMMDKEGKVIEIPEEREELAIQMPVSEPLPKSEPEEPKSDTDDLFEVPQPEDNDMRTDHLIAAPEEDDMSDLTDPPEEEDLSDLFTGEQPAEEPERAIRPPVRRYVRTNRPYYPPPTSLKGLRQ